MTDDPEVELEQRLYLGGEPAIYLDVTREVVDAFEAAGLLSGQRASVWRGNPLAFNRERSQAAAYVSKNKRKAADVWGANLVGDEAEYLRASLVDYMAYGPGSSKFALFVEGFRPGENMPTKTKIMIMTATARTNRPLLRSTLFAALVCLSGWPLLRPSVART